MKNVYDLLFPGSAGTCSPFTGEVESKLDVIERDRADVPSHSLVSQTIYR
jgi:hypothetical protein